MLHLLNQQLPQGGWEAPASLTQAGISAAVHVQRKHIPRTLKRMEKSGYLSVAQRHIPGGKQRKRVYTLTEVGQGMANSLAERVLNEQVQRGSETLPLAEVWDRTIPLLELLSRVDEALVIQNTPLVSPVSNPEGMASIDAQHGEALVRRMYARAWEDGKITRTNNPSSTRSLNSSACTPSVRRLSNEARKSLKIPPPEEVYFDMILQALDDGEILQDEIDLLDTFRVHFGMTKSRTTLCSTRLEQPPHSPNTTKRMLQP